MDELKIATFRHAQILRRFFVWGRQRKEAAKHMMLLHAALEESKLKYQRKLIDFVENMDDDG